ncbi:zinc-binding dehydrogenase [Rhodococcoides fascians]|uniref:zinc-binding dehydrogenase n=1 Tax=Rhodococcoides fascians TaxID=1828 RepID=UPI000561117F|nr:quinone oxidoreductase [Rhodococcus fascians]
MFAAFVEKTDAQNPLAALRLGERPEPDAREGWTTLRVRAASLNHHDIFSLRGSGLADENLPMILGCDVAGVTEDGREVVAHSVIPTGAWADDPLLDPNMSMLSEREQGTFAEFVSVPTQNLVPKPAELTFEEAACLPTSWVTAYRMLFGQGAGLKPGHTVLVQGAGGGLSSALVMLGSAAGLRMWVTSRQPGKGEQAVKWGAADAFASGARLPERVDAVMDSVGASTWTHSLRSLRPGGAMIVAGGTSGYLAEVEVARIFAKRLRILGSAMGTLGDLESTLAMCVSQHIRPPVQEVLPLNEAARAFETMLDGDVMGKLVLVP